ncbi:MAG: DUF1080 domain-containing protein [Lentisphaeraceae bacterium]|nr:DUF1080 domain-containing protein [Lentisphaeraceae bacterium]
MKFFAMLMALMLCVSDFSEEMKPIFNGTDLSEWKVPKNNIWWTVKDGTIHCQSGPKKKGSDLWSKKTYKDFVIELEFKMGEGTVDSGLFIRNSDQIQIGISGSLKRDMTCSPYIPKKGYPKEAVGVKEILKPKDWNILKVKAVGNKYTIWLNGKEVNEYESATAKKEGPVGLQLHGNRTMQISFRNIKLAEIN